MLYIIIKEFGWIYEINNLSLSIIIKINKNMKIGDKVRFTNNGTFAAPTGSTARIVGIEPRYIKIEWIDKGDSFQDDGRYYPEYFEVIEEGLDVLPTKWAIKTTSETRKIINDFIISQGYYGTWNDDYFAHYPFTVGGGSAFGYVRGGYTEISFETFEKLVLNKEIKTKHIMSKQKLTVSITDVLEIHKIACTTWKETIAKYLTRVDSDQNITFTQEEVDKMFKAATKTQLPKLEDIFGDQHKEPTLEDIADGRLLFKGPNSCSTAAGMIEVRSFYEYENKAFWLSDYYNLEIKKDILI
jgi:hypothetical protein